MHQRTCPCGKTFTPRSGNQRYHDRRCAKRYENCKRYGTTPSAVPVGQPFDCAWCGKRCVPGQDGVDAKATRFCGKAHVKAWHRVHVEGRPVPGVRRERRDDNVRRRWLGRIMREPTDRDLTRYRKVLRADPCSYCGAEAEALDHIEPRSGGAADDWTNRTPTCHSCNSLKGTLPLLVALLWIPVATEYHALRRTLYNAER